MKSQLSPRELGEALGVSESSLKRWADDGLLAAARTAGGHRRISLGEAIRFAREQGIAVARPEMLGLVEAEAGAGTGEPALAEALRSGDERRARGQIEARYLAGWSVAEIADGPIAHALEEIGGRWQQGDNGIFCEHRATEICIRAVQQLRLLLPRPRADAPRAVGGAPAGDPYLLPTLLCGTVLAAEGWHDTNLGAETPDETLAEAARETDAALVWIAFAGTGDAERKTGFARHVARRAADAGASVVVGGRGWPAQAGNLPPNLHVGRTMGELAAFARGLARGRAGDRSEEEHTDG